MDDELRVIPGKQQLRYNFTEGEMAELGRSLCEALREEDKINEAAATAKAEFKSRLGKATEKVAEWAAKIRAGYEMREVSTEKRLDFKGGICRVVRLDTGEIIEERGLLSEERQLILDVARDSALDTMEKALKQQPEKPPEAQA